VLGPAKGKKVDIIKYRRRKEAITSTSAIGKKYLRVKITGINI
jgi:ribosomal protein L21